MIDSFLEHRPLLFGIAYRMLGRIVEAEDMVQETYLRWHRQDPALIREPRAWLVAAVTRLCIDQLRSARRQREEYTGVWLPEPIVSDLSDFSGESGSEDSLSMAFLLMLEALSPVERAVFLLREAFGYDYSEIAAIVDKSEANCRQMIHRARTRIARRKSESPPARRETERIVREFLTACATGKLEDLMALLTDDAVFYSDGGGKVRAAIRPVYTADRIGRLFIGIRRNIPEGTENRLMLVNGEPGCVSRRPDGSISVSTFVIENGRVKAVYIVRNPDKLQRIPL